MNYTVLAAAYAADRFNKGFVNSQSEKFYEKKFANRTVIRRLLGDEPSVEIDIEITEEDRVNAAVAKQSLPSITMKIMSDTATEFEEKVYAILGAPETAYRELGICAYFPEFFRNQKSFDEFRKIVKTLTDQSLKQGDKISGKATVLRVKPVNEKCVYLLNFEGSLVSFWSNDVFEGEVYIERAKVKQISSNFEVKTVQEAQLHYVKVRT